MINRNKATLSALLLLLATSTHSQELILHWADAAQAHDAQWLSEVSGETGTELSFVRALNGSFDLISTQEALTPSQLDSLKSSHFIRQVEINQLIHIPDLNRAPVDKEASNVHQTSSLKAPRSMAFDRFNDPLFINQIYLDEQQAPAWGLSSLAKARAYAVAHKQIDRKVRIGVLDTGRWPHEDMQWSAEQANLVSHRSTGEFSCRGSVPVAGSAFCPFPVKEVRSNDALDMGWTENAEGRYQVSIDGHGLAVASQIAAIANNGKGMVGIMPHDAVEIIPIRVLSSGGFGSNLDIAEGISWAIGNSVDGLEDISAPVDIISMSLGGTAPTSCYDDSYTQALIKEAYDKEISVVIAAGNESMDTRFSNPAQCEQAFTVASNQTSGELSSFSNYGALVDVSAKGEHVLGGSINSQIFLGDSDCNDPSRCYATHSGTSMSTPNMAALLGLVKMVYPDIGAKEREAMIQSTARPALRASNGAATKASVLGYGSGVANGEAAMHANQTLDLHRQQIRHRFEGFTSAAQQQYLQQLNQSSNTACHLYDIELGWLSHASKGIVYEVLVSDNSEAVNADSRVLIRTASPHFSIDASQFDNAAARVCRNSDCGDLVALDFTQAPLPNLCR